jgi:predicted nuclease of predicted toxin-antitoxin system
VRLLVDECLSPALAREAQQFGIEAYHLAHVGRAAAPDWEVLAYALSHDMVLATNNASDFRRLYAAQQLHPGLVILVPNMGREMQLRLFREALAQLRDLGELVNRALEIDVDGDALLRRVYRLASPS